MTVVCPEVYLDAGLGLTQRCTVTIIQGLQGEQVIDCAKALAIFIVRKRHDNRLVGVTRTTD